MSKLLATDVLSGNQLRKELRLQSADVNFLNSCSETKVPAMCAESVTILVEQKPDHA